MAFLLRIDEMTLIIVLGLAFFGMVPFLLIGVVYYVLKKNRQAVVAWEKLSREINFRMPERGKLWMTGNYNGFEAHVLIRVETHRSHDGPTTTERFTYCTMKFKEPLRFAMLLKSPRGLLSGITGGKLNTGNQTFDSEFACVCYDSSVLRRLLFSEFPSKVTSNLSVDLLLASRSFNTIVVSDKQVKVETSGQVASPDILKSMLATTYRLADRFSAARVAFPPSEWEKQLTANWRKIAAGRSLVFDESNLTLQGNYGGYPISVSVFAEPGIWKTDIEIKFPKPLMIGFNIFPELSIHKAVKLFGFQDVKAGHAEFDKAYIVKAKNVAMAKTKMTQGFCAQMVGLDQHTHNISLTDEGMKITLEEILGDDKSLTSYLKAIISAMDKLENSP